MRIRCALGPVTTIILLAAKGVRTLIVRKIKLTPWILANAFDRPIRLDKPAASTMICSLKSSLRIIDTVSQMPAQPYPVLAGAAHAKELINMPENGMHID